MSFKTVYKLPVIEKSVVLETKLPTILEKPKRDEQAEVENRKRELEEVSRESYERGWNDAVEKMQGKIIEENDLLCKGLKKAVEELKNERDTIWENCEPEIIFLTLAIAKKITGAEISKYSKEITERIVAEAICKVKGKKISRICINEKDLEGFELMKISGINEMKGECEVTKDTDVSPGGCVVVTDYGSVDATIETRWEEIAATLEVENKRGEREE